MEILGTTRVVAIFGDPVEQSLSPVIQNAAFRALNIDMVYVPFHVRGSDLEGAVDSIRSLSMAGANITVPHKEAVLPLLDRLTPEAESLGAVNTIVNDNSVLTGHNTDGEGYVRSLTMETGFKCEGKCALIIGAGGAARAIAGGLASRGAKRIIIANRTIEKAERLTRDIAPMFTDVAFQETSFDTGRDGGAIEDGKVVAEADLIVNTTSIGMFGRGSLNIKLELADKRAIVSDIVYKPLETELIAEARGLGLIAHCGLGMLIHQGGAGFELWTGEQAPIKVMEDSARASILKTSESGEGV